MRSDSLRVKAVDNIFWSGLGQFGSYGLRYLILLVLAWKLIPADFGLESLTTVVILLVQEMGGLGLEAALIQREDVSELELNTVFWSTLAFSLVLTGVVYSLADEFALLLGDLRAAPLLKTLSFALPFRALIIVPHSKLAKGLQFKQLTIVQFAEQICYGVVALALAFAGRGVWSLVISRLVMMAARAVFTWSYVSWAPSRQFRWQEFRGLIKFGYHSLASNLLTRGLVRVDYFLIGRLLGTKELGYYTLASQIALFPVQRLVGAVQRVAFPAFARVQREMKRMKSGILDVLRALLGLLLPYNLLLLSIGPMVIGLLYGEKWAPAAALIQILSFASIFNAFDITKAVFFARGAPQIWTGVISSRILLFVVFSLVFGIRYGTPGIAACFVASFALTGVYSMFSAGRKIRMTMREFTLVIWRPALGVVLAALPWMGFRLLPAIQEASFVNLILLLGMMGLLYGVVIYPDYRRYVQEPAALFIQNFRKGSPGEADEGDM